MHHLAERCKVHNAILAQEIDAAFADLHRQVNSRDKMLRDKDEAMGVLFKRLDAAGVDYSDLIP
jgi:hypothetical protein